MAQSLRSNISASNGPKGQRLVFRGSVHLAVSFGTTHVVVGNEFPHLEAKNTEPTWNACERRGPLAGPLQARAQAPKAGESQAPLSRTRAEVRLLLPLFQRAQLPRPLSSLQLIQFTWPSQCYRTDFPLHFPRRRRSPPGESQCGTGVVAFKTRHMYNLGRLRRSTSGG